MQEQLAKRILPENPYATLEVGICREHGGDPRTIDFCHRIDHDDVSCSPFRVQVARLAAAHAAPREEAKAGKRS